MENNFEFIMFDYYQTNNIQKLFGNSEFIFILNVIYGQNLIQNSKLEFNAPNCTYNINLGTNEALCIDSCKQPSIADPLIFGSYNIPYPKFGSGITGVRQLRNRRWLRQYLPL